MTLTRKMLDTQYAWWFHSKRNTEQANEKILNLFSEEPDNSHERTKQDIYDQSRKIIIRWDNA